MSDYWWIPDPLGHRRHEQESTPVVPPGFEGAVIDMAALAGSMWVCDLCNEEIRTVKDDGDLNPVPMLGSNALCARCMVEHGMENWMVNVGCACPPCQRQTVRWMGAN